MRPSSSPSTPGPGGASRRRGARAAPGSARRAGAHLVEVHCAAHAAADGLKCVAVGVGRLLLLSVDLPALVHGVDSVDDTLEPSMPWPYAPCTTTLAVWRASAAVTGRSLWALRGIMGSLLLGFGD